MSQYNQGEIVIIEYPFSDGTGAKLRPVVVLSNTKANTEEQDLVFAKITTNQRSDDYSLALSDSDTLRPLPRNSEIRANKIYTLDKSLIQRKVTTLSNTALQKLIDLVHTVIKTS